MVFTSKLAGLMPGHFTEETGEVSGILESQLVGDFVNGFFRIDQATFGFCELSVVNKLQGTQVTGEAAEPR